MVVSHRLGGTSRLAGVTRSNKEGRQETTYDAAKP